MVRIKSLLPQFARFAAVGVVATAIQYITLMIGVELLGWSAATGSGVGFVLSSVVNYVLNYRFTFRSSRAHASALWRFGVVTSIGLLLNVLLMMLLTEHWRFPYLLAQVLVTGMTLIWNFTGSVYWSFVPPDAASAGPVSRRS
jgi:putative flippase GtrA